MRAMLLVLCYVLGLAGVALTCSPPQNWKSRPPIERLEEAELVILAQFTATSERARGGTNAADTVLSTKVKCVLKNTKNVDVPASLEIFEETEDTNFKCVRNVADEIDLNKDVLVMVAPDSDRGGYSFNNVNVQGAMIYTTDLDISDVIKKCTFKSSKWLTCAEVTPSEVCGSRGSGLQSMAGPALTLAVVVLVSVMAGEWYWV